MSSFTLTRNALRFLSLVVLIQGGFSIAEAGTLDLSYERYNSTVATSYDSPSESTKKFVILGAQKAIASLQEAISNSYQDYNISGKLQRSLESLENARVIWPDGEDDATCLSTADRGAYVNPGIKVIHICKMALDHGQVNALAEVLIHESVHIGQSGQWPNGVDDVGNRINLQAECEATDVEIYTAKHSSLKIQMKTTYWGVCKVNPN